MRKPDSRIAFEDNQNAKDIWFQRAGHWSERESREIHPAMGFGAAARSKLLQSLTLITLSPPSNEWSD